MTESEQAALVNARSDALSLACDLEEVAAALRVIALGQTDAGDCAFVRGALDHHGDLVVRGQIAWELLFAHAGDEVRS